MTARLHDARLSWDEIRDVELVILRRMKELAAGAHASVFHGAGFDLVGLRDWQPGDRPSAIDWPQSTITNYAPLVVREFEQPSTATITAVADVSQSTRCGVEGTPIATLIARAIATIGMSAVFFQDPFGLVTFDDDFTHLACIRPRTGRGHVVHCLDAYQFQRGLDPMRRTADIATTLASYFRSPTLLPVISDFLFDQAHAVVRELALLNHRHDVFLVLVDSAFAFELPAVSAGWIETADVETGRVRTLGRAAYRQLGTRVREWQASVEGAAREAGLDVVRIELDPQRFEHALVELMDERRLRKTQG